MRKSSISVQLTSTKEVKKRVKKIDPPFGYFGSKSNIALKLCQNLPAHNCWVEAFCGSAAVTLSKAQAPIEIINDKDTEIVNLFEQLRDNYGELMRLIEYTPYAEQEFLNARIPKPLDELSKEERARRFLIQSMMAINGVFGKERGGFSFSDSYSRNGKEARVNRWYNLPERLDAVVERLKNVRIENKDARELIKRYVDRPATLIYLDPPYFADRTNGYTIDANEIDFQMELLEIANRAKCMMFISGYDNELYNTFLCPSRGWKKRRIATSTKDSTGGIHDRTEVIWMNSPFVKGLKSGRTPLRLSAKEKKNVKVNPSRK